MSKENEASSGETGDMELADLSPATAARLLSVLLITPDEELLDYRRRCIDKDSDLSAEHLGAVRRILELLGATLLSTNDEQWQRVLGVRDLLDEPLPAHELTGEESRDEPPAPLSAPPSVGAPAPPPPVGAPAPLSAPPSVAGPAPPSLGAPVPPPSVGVPAPLSAPPSVGAPVPPPSVSIDETGEQPVPGSVSDPASSVALPFDGSADAPAPAAPELAATGAPDRGETAALGQRSPLADITLPFSQGASEEQPVATSSAPSSQASTESAAPVEGPAESGATVGVGQLSPLAMAGVPFPKKTVASPAVGPPSESTSPNRDASDQGAVGGDAAGDTKGELATAQPEVEPSSESGMTAYVGQTSPLSGMELPFQATGSTPAANASNTTELTMEQYAAFWVECSGAPAERVGQIHQKYGINDATARRALDDHWRRQFERDPALRARFDQLIARSPTSSGKPQG